jgi:hypothetical protein
MTLEPSRDRTRPNAARSADADCSTTRLTLPSTAEAATLEDANARAPSHTLDRIRVAAGGEARFH